MNSLTLKTAGAGVRRRAGPGRERGGNGGDRGGTGAGSGLDRGRNGGTTAASSNIRGGVFVRSSICPLLYIDLFHLD